jgi:hypothetical protein
LRADFQQWYGLNLDDMGGDYSISHAACLAAQLPGDSRTFAAFRREEAASEPSGKTQGESLPIDEYMELLSRPRKEVQHG